MSEPSTAVKKGRKFDQVLDAACQIFLTDGFDRANMDDIAARAGVSKATVYSYFPDKRLLFMEAAKTEINRRAMDAETAIPEGTPVALVLEFTARILSEFALSEFGKNLFRICISNAEEFPELGQMFFESGPEMALNRLADYFRDATEQGELNVDDPRFAAAQFVELCKADIFVRTMLGVPPEITKDQVDKVVKGAVEMFLARYGAA